MARRCNFASRSLCKVINVMVGNAFFFLGWAELTLEFP